MGGLPSASGPYSKLYPIFQLNERFEEMPQRICLKMCINFAKIEFVIIERIRLKIALF
jgi:hypothetical protein